MRRFLIFRSADTSGAEDIDDDADADVDDDDIDVDSPPAAEIAVERVVEPVHPRAADGQRLFLLLGVVLQHHAARQGPLQGIVERRSRPGLYLQGGSGRKAQRQERRNLFIAFQSIHQRRDLHRRCRRLNRVDDVIVNFVVIILIVIIVVVIITILSVFFLRLLGHRSGVDEKEEDLASGALRRERSDDQTVSRPTVRP